MTETRMCTPQPNYVIVESVHPKSGLPGKGGVGPGLRQVHRKVLQVCDVQDVFFEGERVRGMPSVWQYLKEFVTPGRQITTRPTGKREFMLVYSGWRNLLRPLPEFDFLPEATTREYDLGTPASPFVYGTDPIPEVQLQGRKNVDFVSPGGNGPPTAVGLYDGRTRSLTVPPKERRQEMLRAMRAGTPAG